MESPSKYTDLLAPRFPFTQSLALALHPSVCGDGAGSLPHWSRFAEGFASVNVVCAVKPDVPPTAVSRKLPPAESSGSTYHQVLKPPAESAVTPHGL